MSSEKMSLVASSFAWLEQKGSLAFCDFSQPQGALAYARAPCATQSLAVCKSGSRCAPASLSKRCCSGDLYVCTADAAGWCRVHQEGWTAWGPQEISLLTHTSGTWSTSWAGQEVTVAVSCHSHLTGFDPGSAGTEWVSCECAWSCLWRGRSCGHWCMWTWVKWMSDSCWVCYW